jgi:hypothetical protein
VIFVEFGLILGTPITTVRREGAKSLKKWGAGPMADTKEVGSPEHIKG